MSRRAHSIGAHNPSWPYVAPFALYLLMMALGFLLPGGAALHYPLRIAVVAAVTIVWSRGVVCLKAARWVSSVLVGVGVYLVWIGPDVLWPAYRSHWLLQNAVTGTAASSVPEALRTNLVFLTFRVAGSAVLVPIVEELFWRAWLMRYLISRRFETLALGASTAGSFWLSALLFASEHGPYWDVGLAAGIVYNWWMIRTRSLADCILAHSATNACLAVHVLAANQWQYWL